jgi:hypothetical protein
MAAEVNGIKCTAAIAKTDVKGSEKANVNSSSDWSQQAKAKLTSPPEREAHRRKREGTAG